MSKPLNTVACTAGFLSQAKAEGMAEAELEAMERLLAANPEADEMIVGSGGCRKVRIARQSQGKSGGYRVVTYFTTEDMPVYCIAVLAKGSCANLSTAEVSAMAAFAKRIKETTQRRA